MPTSLIICYSCSLASLCRRTRADVAVLRTANCASNSMLCQRLSNSHRLLLCGEKNKIQFSTRTEKPLVTFSISATVALALLTHSVPVCFTHLACFLLKMTTSSCPPLIFALIAVAILIPWLLRQDDLLLIPVTQSVTA